jgi:hypothetical protein
VIARDRLIGKPRRLQGLLHIYRHGYLANSSQFKADSAANQRETHEFLSPVFHFAIKQRKTLRSPLCKAIMDAAEMRPLSYFAIDSL